MCCLCLAADKPELKDAKDKVNYSVGYQVGGDFNMSKRASSLLPGSTDESGLNTFRQVTVHGNSGLLITMTGKGPGEGEHQREGSVVMWSEGDRVFAVGSGFRGPAPASGRLALGMNDVAGTYGDNEGSLNVVVKLE